jgi:hypothetical protein
MARLLLSIAIVALSLVSVGLLGGAPAGLAQGIAGTPARADTWTSAGLAGQAIASVVSDPDNSDVVYAAGSGGVFKSTNEGAHWRSVNNGLPAFPVQSLAIDPRRPNTVYAAVGRSGVYKTTNGGASWAAVNTGLPSTVYARSLTIDPRNPDTVYVNHVSGDPPGDPLFKTTNGGASWSSASTGLCGFDNTEIAIDPITPTTLYAVQLPCPISKSTDGGASWTPFSSGPANGLPSDCCAGRDVVLDPYRPTTLYVAVGSQGLFKSTDGGVHWSPASNGLPVPFNAEVLASNPRDSATLYLLAGTSGLPQGVFKTANGGASWTPFNNGLPSPVLVNSLAVAADDRGRPAWAPPERRDNDERGRQARTGVTLYAGTNNGVFKLHESSPDRAADTPTVVTFSTPGTSLWTVPAHVVSATFDVFGAQGGGGAGVTDSFQATQNGGLGGEAQVTISVRPGQTFQVNVGGRGGDGMNSSGANGGIGGPGGFNGGGGGGPFGGAYVGGGGGGGASDVRSGSITLNDR